MIVEFVGPPGAGKTTIAQELARLTGQTSLTLDGYRARDGRILSRREVTVHRWWSLVSQPRLANEALDCARLEGRGLALSWMINLARRNSMMRSLRGHDMILEEGTLSALCLAQAARSQQWEMLAVLPRLTHGDRVIVLHIDPDTAVERIRVRQGILADRDDDELRKLFFGYNAALATLSGALDSSPIHVGSDGPPSTIAAKLRQLLDLHPRLAT